MLGFEYGEFSAVYRLPHPLSTTWPAAVGVAPEPAVRGPPEPAMTAPAPAGGRPIVLIGLMGAGKSSVGKRLAKRLKLRFVDADAEIVNAAGCSIEDIFEVYGEAAFRDVERRVIARLLDGSGFVLAIGGGAYLDAATRALIGERAVSVWLRAPLEVLVRRTGRRGGRPLLKGGDPAEILERLMAERHPIYGQADLVVDTGDEQPDDTVERIVKVLEGSAGPAARASGARP